MIHRFKTAFVFQNFTQIDRLATQSRRIAFVLTQFGAYPWVTLLQFPPGRKKKKKKKKNKKEKKTKKKTKKKKTSCGVVTNLAPPARFRMISRDTFGFKEAVSKFSTPRGIRPGGPLLFFSFFFFSDCAGAGSTAQHLQKPCFPYKGKKARCRQYGLRLSTTKFCRLKTEGRWTRRSRAGLKWITQGSEWWCLIRKGISGKPSPLFRHSYKLICTVVHSGQKNGTPGKG